MRGVPKKHPHSWPAWPPWPPLSKFMVSPSTQTVKHRSLIPWAHQQEASVPSSSWADTAVGAPSCAGGRGWVPAEPPWVGAVRESAGGLGSNPTRPILHRASASSHLKWVQSPVFTAPQHPSGHLSLRRRVPRPPSELAAGAALACHAGRGSVPCTSEELSGAGF